MTSVSGPALSAAASSRGSLMTEEPVPMSTARTAKGGRTAIYDLFKCKGGKQVFIGLLSDPQWVRACSVLGMEDLLNDQRLKYNAGRGEHRAMLMERISKAVADRESKDLVDALVKAGVTVAPVNTPLSVMDDEHVCAPGRTLPAQIGNKTGRLPPLPYESSNYKFEVRHHAPAEPGKHTSEILKELGFSVAEITAMAGNAVVRGPDLAGKV